MIEFETGEKNVYEMTTTVWSLQHVWEENGDSFTPQPAFYDEDASLLAGLSAGAAAHTVLPEKVYTLDCPVQIRRLRMSFSLAQFSFFD